ncbi:HHR092Cp [Eremothecium sinecaudum]|uniref:HHR092Cp n=1 Tax=Eremothecium sinecaudum TaxID=45286 RepID=A0A109V0I6_9SACH|nr:HHR092Cp [Eremothecium sinecaudum]AMD22861.1 HHR092Cp [Eremothecium sinecaudum]
MDSSEVEASSSSVSAFVSTLIFNGLIALLFVFLFLTLRPREQRVYQPRSLKDISTIHDSERTESVPGGYFKWIPFLMNKPHSFLIQHMSVDGYFFTRYLLIFGLLSLLGCLILFPILLPVNAVRGFRLGGFERLAFSNVSNRNRFFAHAFLSWVYFGLVIYTIYRELYYYISMRHALQTTPYYSSQVGSRTVIFTDLKLCGKSNVSLEDESTIREVFPGVEHVVFARDEHQLQKLVKERRKVANKYENTLNKVINKSVKVRRKAEFNEKLGDLPRPELDDNDFEKYMKNRPTHRLGKIPCIGEKVDSLDYLPKTLGQLNQKIKKGQMEWTEAPLAGACFITFKDQRSAQKAFQTAPAVLGRAAYDKRIIGYAPEDINWDNISLGRAARKSKRTVTNAILAAMIIFWAIPVAVVGTISNIHFLTEKVHFLRFINNMPRPLMGIITGLLPSIALAILISLVPVIIKKLGVFGGSITRQENELYCQACFFAFQVVQVFLVTTLASSAAATVAPIINNPDQSMTLLSSNLPKASNFYITYFLLSLSVATGLLFQLVTLLLSKVLGRLLDSTPRKKWNRYNQLSKPSWGIIYPINELLVCIFLVYSIVSPLLMIFSFVAFIVFYLSYLYNLNYVYGFSYDLKGRNYVRALFQVFVGLYLAEVCLLGLFIMAKAWGPLVLNIISLLVTVICHLYFQRRFLPLVDAVPLSVLRHAENVGNYIYPAKDQGRNEVLDLGDPNSAHYTITETSNGDKIVAPASPTDNTNRLYDAGDDYGNYATEKNELSQSPTADTNGITGYVKTYFTPSSCYTYPRVKNRLPSTLDTPVTYEPGYEETAYTDPCVLDKEPIIWAANDPMGVASEQVRIAREFGVKGAVDNTGYDGNGKSIYTGDPPDYDINTKT